MGHRAGSEEELQRAAASCFHEEGGFPACHIVLKAILLLAEKILILLVCFFQGQLIFPVRDALFANQGGTTKKKS